MIVTSFVPLENGTRFIIKESISNLWHNIIEDIKIVLKKSLPSIIDVQISSQIKGKSVNYSIDVIHDYSQITETAILNVLRRIIFNKDKKPILS